MTENLTWNLTTLTTSNNGSFLEVYKAPNDLNGEIFDFFCTISLTSIAELPPVPKPDGVELMRENELDAAWVEATKDAQKKVLNIAYQNLSGTTLTSTEFVIMRITPSYTENMLPYLTWHNTLLVPKGCRILAKVAALNSGLLSGTDKIEFRVTAKETFKPDIDYLAAKYLLS